MAEPTALVTGAHGFVGRHVCRALAARGVRVTGLGHGRWQPGEERAWGLAVWVEADVSAEALLALGPSGVVFHCAGSGSVGPTLAAPAAERRRTVDSTAAVLEYARRSGAAPVVLASSVSVYGSTGAGSAAEDAPARPSSPYAEHKLAAEALCLEYGRAHGVPSVAVRLSSVYGPGLRKQLLWDACRRLSAGDAVFGGTGDERRDWLHAEDAATLLVEAGARALPSGLVVNGGSGEATPVRLVLEEVAATLGRGRPAFSGEVRPGDPEHLIPDVRRARGWGWRPEVRWREGVRAYCRWFAGEPR